MLEKVEKKVSLNIKVPAELDLRLKRARKTARDQGMIFNVSKEVEQALEKELKKVEKILGIEQDINESLNQLELVEPEPTKPKRQTKK